MRPWNLTRLWFLAATLMVFVGCTDEIVTLPSVSDNSLFDPSIQPRVLYTYPPNHGTGPFSVYSPTTYLVYGTGLPHFVVQFNKVIYVSSISLSSVHCEGFSQPTDVRVIDASEYYGTPGLNVVSFVILGTGNQPMYYRVGKTYRVTLDSTIRDINGNRLEHPYSFTFLPEPRFRILDYSPQLRMSLGQSDTVSAFIQPELRFNSPVDSQMLSSIVIVPRPNGKWVYSTSDSLGARFRPDSGFRMGVGYSITVPQGSADVFGNPLAEEFQLRFKTYEFSISMNGPVDDTLGYLATSLSWSTSGPMDTATFRPAYAIIPPVEGAFTYSRGYASFTPSTNFAPASRYTVRIATSLRSIFGDSLLAPEENSFFTSEFRVNSTYPRNGDRNIPRTEDIRIFTNASLDTSTIRTAFAFSPDVQGKFILGSTYFFFRPDSILPANATFQVSVSPSLMALGSYPLPRLLEFSFTTGSN